MDNVDHINKNRDVKNVNCKSVKSAPLAYHLTPIVGLFLKKGHFWVPFVSVWGPLWFLLCSKLHLPFKILGTSLNGPHYPCYISEIRKFFSMKFITGSDFNNTRISCQENLDLWIVLFASGELLSLSCTHSLILRSQFRRDQKPRKKLFQIIQIFLNGSLINMQ